MSIGNLKKNNSTIRLTFKLYKLKVSSTMFILKKHVGVASIILKP